MYKHFWHYDNKKLKKILPWMKSYTSRQIAPKLYREDTSLHVPQGQNFGDWKKNW